MCPGNQVANMPHTAGTSLHWYLTRPVILLTGEILRQSAGFPVFGFSCFCRIFSFWVGIWGLGGSPIDRRVLWDSFGEILSPRNATWVFVRTCCMICQLFQQVEVVVWHGIHRMSGQVGQICSNQLPGPIRKDSLWKMMQIHSAIVSRSVFFVSVVTKSDFWI